MCTALHGKTFLADKHITQRGAQECVMLRDVYVQGLGFPFNPTCPIVL